MGKYKHIPSCNEKYHVPKYECGRISMFPFLLWEMAVLPILLREKISVPNPAMGKYPCFLDLL
jgi:hypothetical protein